MSKTLPGSIEVESPPEAPVTTPESSLWLTRDKEGGHGLSLFSGTNPPQWDDGISQSRDDGACEYLGELSESHIPHIVIQPLETIQVVIAKPIVRPVVEE